MLILIRATY
ncbi:hypothetical protein VCHENC02_2973A, partial [Vibrio harveyi]